MRTTPRLCVAGVVGLGPIIQLPVVHGWSGSWHAMSAKILPCHDKVEGLDHERRKVLGMVLSLSIANSFAPSTCQAAIPLDAGEAIRRSAANLPGYGPTDVFFPSTLAGTWQMNREVDFGSGREPLRLSYPFRFIPSIDDNAVVADRGFNQAALEQAIARAVTGREDASSSSSSSLSSTVRTYDWLPSNPNDLRMVLSDGSRKEIKVTKRATELTDTTVSSSEFQRITQDDARGIPTISARRVMTKWKLVDDSTLEGLEVIYSMPGGDPMAAPAGTQTSSTLLSKSRLLLQRQSQSSP